MYPRLLSLALAVAFGLAGLSGCQSCCNKTAPVQSDCPNCVDQIQPPPAPRMVPVPLTPGVGPVGGPCAGDLPDALSRTSACARRDRYACSPGPTARWPGIRHPPIQEFLEEQSPPPPGAERRDAGRAPSGISKEPPIASVPSKPVPSVDERRETPDPIDIPSYTLAVPNVASGLKPFPDGIDWLKQRGFKTILHLKQPGEEDTAVRRLCSRRRVSDSSQRGRHLRGVTTKELYEQFNRLVTDTASHPLYVFDRRIDPWRRGCGIFISEFT